MSSINYNPENFDVESVQCRLCGKEYEMTLNGHLSRTHDLTAPEYRDKVGQDAPIVTRQQVYKMHNKVVNPYTDDMNDFWKEMQGTLDFDFEDAPTVTDTYETVSCRICGNNYRNLGKHIPTHNIRVETYQDLYPNAPLVSDAFSNNVGRPRTVVGKYDWRDDLPWTKNAILENKSILRNIESQDWFDGDVYDKAMEALNENLNDAKGHNFVPTLLGALYYGANFGSRMVNPDKISSLTDDVSKKAILNKSVKMGSLINSPGDVLNGLELPEDEDEEVRDVLLNFPNKFVGSRNARVVTSLAMYFATDKTQKECSDLTDSNPESLRGAKKSLYTEWNWDEE